MPQRQLRGPQRQGGWYLVSSGGAAVSYKYSTKIGGQQGEPGGLLKPFQLPQRAGRGLKGPWTATTITLE